MARVTNAGASTPQYAPKKPKQVLPAGTYTVGIMDVRVDQTKSGTSYLCLTLCTETGHQWDERIYGWADNGKGPWVARVVERLALCCQGQFVAVADVPRQPHEDYDWEREADIGALCLGGVLFAEIGIEPPSVGADGKDYPEKNKVNWLRTKGADPATVAQFRKLPTWAAQADQLKKSRITAIDLWRAELMRAESGAVPASPFDDDAIPY
jgi:hypothetical protein